MNKKNCAIKRCFVLLCAIVLFSTAFPTLAFAKTYTNRSDVDGTMYTKSTALARKLNSIFDGNASIYKKNTYASSALVNTAIGKKAVPDNGVTLYAGKKGYSGNNSGTSCWIYANGVYYTLFGETTGNGTAGENSQKLNLGSNKKFNYQNFKNWGVRNTPGALIRVSGHSLIILKYDSSKIYYLDGNGDNQGTIAVREYKWESCPWYGKNISYIIQPKQAYYNSLYPEETPAAYIARCKEYICYGNITMKKNATVMSTPATNHIDTLLTAQELGTAQKGTTYKVTRVICNTSGNYWYKLDYNGKTGYVYGGYCTHKANKRYNGYYYTPDGKTLKQVK